MLHFLRSRWPAVDRFEAPPHADWRVAAWTCLVITSGAIAAAWTAPQRAKPHAAISIVGSIRIDAVPVPLNPSDPSVTTIGDFRYAGGVMLTSRQTDLLHELSDIILTGNDRFAAVGDEGVLLEARLVFDEAGRLVGVSDADLARLLGPDGKPVTGSFADAEGVTTLATGDRLVSFERHPRIWLYPRDGSPPRPVPSPRVRFQSNQGMEALTAAPDVAENAYIVGAEDSGRTWTCRVTASCVKRATVEKPKEYGLVSMNGLPDGMIAYLLRAYDRRRGVRITLKILRDKTVVARMDLAPPMTVDNFEGVTSTAIPDGGRRFYLISDDNKHPSQRTLLLAFDWEPR